jgi:hypothetical protein
MVAHHLQADMAVEKGGRVIIIVGPFNELHCYRLPKHIDCSSNCSSIGTGRQKDKVLFKYSSQQMPRGK